MNKRNNKKVIYIYIYIYILTRDHLFTLHFVIITIIPYGWNLIRF